MSFFLYKVFLYISWIIFFIDIVFKFMMKKIGIVINIDI